ncbi:hypothetical protein, partial [[Clostridium] innocuum]|uniref:hypothetical protein n=1 Tax=Clostridium innocuum TaxID=1522 RepID=UPI001E548942
LPMEITNLLDMENDTIKRINVVETQEPTIVPEMVAPQEPANLEGNQTDQEEGGSYSDTDSHEYEFKSETEGNPSWGIHP